MANFPPNYFQGEIRDDFYIEPMMKCAWAAEIEVLEVVAEICNRHNIQYFADYGTLLGAVRHKGFIPWDDNIDISMFRSDYERFLKIAPAELPSGWQILNIHNNPFHHQLHTIVRSGLKINYSPDYLNRFHGCPYSVGLDLFPLDVLAPAPDEDHALCELLRILVYTAQVSEENPEQTLSLLPDIENLCHITLDPSQKLKPQLMKAADSLSQIYNTSGGSDISHYASHADSGEKLRLKAEWYQECIVLPFETITVTAPAGYDEVLKVNYGDYMTPVRGTQAHDYPFWKKQERILAECLMEQNNTKENK